MKLTTVSVGLRSSLAILMVVSCAILGADIGSAQSSPRDHELETAIAEAKHQAEIYWEEANQRGAGNMGSFWNDVDSDQHRCVALAGLLGQQPTPTMLDTIAAPILSTNMPSEDVEMLRVYSNSQTNFAIVAKFVLGLSSEDRAYLWNLECVGRFDVSTSQLVQTNTEESMFRVDGSNLYVLGDVKDGFAEQLAREIARHSDITTVYLGSSGGAVIEAIRAGYMIRRLNLNTSLFSDCYSACTIVFIGGVNRGLWAGRITLGFHQVSKYGESISPGSDAYDLLAEYIEDMGVDVRFFLAAMFSARPDSVYVPPPDELCESGVATWIQRACSHE